MLRSGIKKCGVIAAIKNKDPFYLEAKTVSFWKLYKRKENMFFIYFFSFLLLQCMWCSSANLCSDGLDRNKQDWLKKNCERKQNHVGGDPHLPDKIEVCDNAADRFNPDQYHPSYKTEDHSGNDHISDYNSDSLGRNEESDHFKDSKSSEKFLLIIYYFINV